MNPYIKLKAKGGNHTTLDKVDPCYKISSFHRLNYSKPSKSQEQEPNSAFNHEQHMHPQKHVCISSYSIVQSYQSHKNQEPSSA